MQIAAVTDNRLWLLKIGFDEEFSSCSPGQLLILEALRSAASEGLDGVEFLGTPEPWTRMWTNYVRPCVNLLYFPTALRSLPLLADDAWTLLRAGAQ